MLHMCSLASIMNEWMNWLLLLLSYDEHVSIDSLHVTSLLTCWGLTTKDSPLAPIVSSTNMATSSLSFEPLGIYMYCKGSMFFISFQAEQLSLLCCRPWRMARGSMAQSVIGGHSECVCMRWCLEKHHSMLNHWWKPTVKLWAMMWVLKKDVFRCENYLCIGITMWSENGQAVSNILLAPTKG